MPTYGYQCMQCQHRLEVFQKITDDPLVECPQCKKKALQREIGGQEATLRMKSSVASPKKDKPSFCSCCCHTHGCPHH